MLSYFYSVSFSAADFDSSNQQSHIGIRKELYPGVWRTG